VIHTSPDTGALAVRFNAEVAISSLAYKQGSPYLGMLTGGHLLHLVNAATPLGTPRVSRKLEFIPGSQTILVVNRSSDLDVLLFPDTNVPSTTADNTFVRLIHAAPGLSSVDIYVTATDTDLATATPIFTSIAYKTATPYLDVPGGNYRIRVTAAGSKTVVSDTNTLTLQKGRVYTSLTVGGGGAPLENTTVLDL
jgi:hypothetical protein